MFEPALTVEIFASDGSYSTSENRRYGSAYRIGGRLVLTAAHLFANGRNCCEVRSEQAQDPSARVAAQIVWISSDADVALLELPAKEFEECEPVLLGTVPASRAATIYRFDLGGWPEFARNGTRPGRMHIWGKISSADTIPVNGGLLKLRIDDESRPSVNSGAQSPWEGCSGAAVVCNGYVVAVQSQHPRVEHLTFLVAEPLSKVCADPTWQKLLKQHGIDPAPQPISQPILPFWQSERIRSVEQEMAEVLQQLNYSDQQTIFDDFLDSAEWAKAFAVAVTYDVEADLQKCLVSRLSRSLMGGEKPEFRTLGVDRSWRQNPTSELLQRLAPSLGLSATASLDEVHGRIAQLCQTQSVVIALYGVPAMGRRKLSTLLDEFWNPLIDLLHGASGTSHRGRLLLFLAGDKPEENWTQQNSLVQLEPPLAQITTAEVRKWWRIREVKQFKNRCEKEKCRRIERPYADGVENLGDSAYETAYETMEKICEAFGFENGLAPFEPFWKLSGDLAA